MKINNNIGQKEILSYLKDMNWSCPVAVTLTERQVFTGDRFTSFQIDDIRSSQNTRQFLNRLNKRIFKNSFSRFGKRLKSFVVMEGNRSTRHHIHAVLDRPSHIPFDDFKDLITDCWSKTKFGYNHTEVKEMYNDGWLKYLVKYRTKENLLSGIDWENTHN